MGKKRVRGQKWLYMIIGILAVLVIFFGLWVLQLKNQPEQSFEPSPSDIALRLGSEPDLQGFVPTQVTKLTGEELATKQAQYPALYGDAHVGDYEVRYPAWWVIYNYEQDTIIKKLRYQSINVG